MNGVMRKSDSSMEISIRAGQGQKVRQDVLMGA